MNSCSYQETQVGPWGVRMNEQMQRDAELNVPFDQLQWEDAKLNGCQPAPCKEYPTWPPPPETGFIYPSLSKVTQQELLGEEKGPGMGSLPFVEMPKLNSPLEEYNGKQYSPEDILNSSECSGPDPAVPRALPGSSYGPTPLDDMSYGLPMHVNAIQGDWVKERFDSNANVGAGAGAAASGPSAPPMPVPPVPAVPPPQQQQPRPPVVVMDIRGGYDNHTSNAPRKCRRYNLEHLMPCMKNAIRGIFYDLAYWDELPTDNKLAWVFGRDDRMFYVATLVFILLVLYAVLQMIAKQLNLPPHILNQAIWIIILAFLIYNLTPRAEGDNDSIKLVAVAVIVIVLVLINIF